MRLRVFSKTSMRNVSFHNFDPSSTGLAIFQEISLNLSRKLHALRWQKLRLQNPLRVYSTPSELSTTLCVLFGNPLRAVVSNIESFPATTKFSSLYAGAFRVFLPCGGNYEEILRYLLRFGYRRGQKDAGSISSQWASLILDRQNKIIIWSVSSLFSTIYAICHFSYAIFINNLFIIIKF